MTSQAPFFILGNPRSGTSLLRIILNAHPRIVVPPESGFLQWWHEKYRDWSKANGDKRLKQFIDDLLTSKKMEDFHLDRVELHSYLEDRHPKSYADLIANIYRYYGREKNVLRWGDKNNYYVHHIPLLKLLFPEASFIHLIRDGRDVACSYLEVNKVIEPDAKYRPNLTNDIRQIAESWIENNERIAEQVSGCDHLVVKFEDLVLDLKNELRRIFNFLNVPWSDEALDYYRKNDEPPSTLKWKEKTLQPIQKNVVGRYKRDLTDRQLKDFEVAASELLSKYHYC